MQSQIRDMYISILEKRASEDVGPDYGTDNQEVSNGEVASNNKDQRAQLSPLFSAVKPTEKAQTSHLNKLLPIAKKTPDTASSNPLLKVAFQVSHQRAFFDGLRRTDMLKTAELDYLRTAYRGFEGELSKIANLAAQVAAATRKSGVSKMLSKARKDLPLKPGTKLRGNLTALKGKPGTANFGKL